MESRQYIIGIDIGGTCTDCVVLDPGGDLVVAKVFSTPPGFTDGILDAVAVAAEDLGLTARQLLESTWLFLHSTTVAENAMADGDFATPGLITTSGFGDTLFATRGGYGRWSGLTDEAKRNPIETDKPAPLVPRTHVRTVRERVDRDGGIVHALDDSDSRAAVEELIDLGVETVGVCLLWGFANPKHEERIARLIREREPDMFVTTSHDLAPVVGEYERTSTVVLNSGLGPVVNKYLSHLDARLSMEGFDGQLLVMQAHGGLIPAARALRRPVGLIESGPVAGLLGSKRLGEHVGVQNIISADMGGTTFKVGVVREGLIDYQRESMVFRYHYALPKMDITSLGIAGGSVVWFDERTGVPRIGPRGAGSYPGPAVYGHGGTEPTVTDVDAVLGFLNRDFFLGGRETLDVDTACAVVEAEVADVLGQPLMDAAASIYRLANARIYDLLHRTTVQRGFDPRSFVLFSTGGTAGMHLPAIADDLGIETVVVPSTAAVHGALGLVTSDVIHEEILARPMHDPVVPASVDEIFRELRETVISQLLEDGFNHAAIEITRSVDVRYKRQVHEVNVPLRENGDRAVTEGLIDEIREDFETLYRQRYGKGSTFEGAGLEFVVFRVRGRGVVQGPDLKPQPEEPKSAEPALVEERPVFLPHEGEMRTIPGFSSERLGAGSEIPGPALVWSPITTILVGDTQTARVDRHLNLVITKTDHQ